MTTILNEKRFTVKDYLMLNDLIDEAIERLDEPTMLRLQALRSKMTNHIYNDGHWDTLKEAIHQRKIERSMKKD